ncbi:Signal transduction histidine-protein kinase BaeS [Serratia rubidaea]|uniref:Signal transduction histidine-protein kinase BaeS n=1 Tax=Serratia rubidaea TaxID=61652 RepID=A0A4U9HNH0_SERRU|nr:Signal transduction histidine-protein kinase BaeS [Serratia rubidaea]
MRLSFERGFIDYIKHSNEQRIAMLSDALEDQYSRHGNWAFLRNNDRVVYQIMRSFEQSSDSSHNLPPKGWRTQFWVVDSQFRRLVGHSGPLPKEGTRQPIRYNNQIVGWVIATPPERLTRNADINFDRQQKRTSWLIAALSALLAAAATLLMSRGLLAPVKRLVAGTHRLAAGDFSARVAVSSQDELGRLAQDFNQLATSLEKKRTHAPSVYGRRLPRAAHPAGGAARRTGGAAGRRAPADAGFARLAAGGSRHADQTGG